MPCVVKIIFIEFKIHKLFSLSLVQCNLDNFQVPTNLGHFSITGRITVCPPYNKDSSDTEPANVIFREEKTIEFKRLMCVAYICHIQSHEFNLVLADLQRWEGIHVF